MNLVEKAYISSHFWVKGINKTASNWVELAVELVIEAKDKNEELFENEVVDLLFYCLIRLSTKGISLTGSIQILEYRN